MSHLHSAFEAAVERSRSVFERLEVFLERSKGEE